MSKDVENANSKMRDWENKPRKLKNKKINKWEHDELTKILENKKRKYWHNEKI